MSDCMSPFNSRRLGRLFSPAGPVNPPEPSFPEWRYLSGPKGDYRYHVDADFKFTTNASLELVNRNLVVDGSTSTFIPNHANGQVPGVIRGDDFIHYGGSLDGELYGIRKSLASRSLSDGSLNWIVSLEDFRTVLNFVFLADVVVVVLRSNDSPSVYSLRTYSLSSGELTSSLVFDSHLSPQDDLFRWSDSRFSLGLHDSVAGTVMTYIYDVVDGAVAPDPAHVHDYFIYTNTSDLVSCFALHGGFTYAVIRKGGESAWRLSKLDMDGNILWQYVHNTDFAYYNTHWMVNPITGSVVGHVYYEDVNDDPAANAESNDSALTLVEIDGDTGDYLRHYTYPDEGAESVGYYYWGQSWAISDGILVMVASEKTVVRFDLESFSPIDVVPFPHRQTGDDKRTPISFNNGVLLWSQGFYDYDAREYTPWISWLGNDSPEVTTVVADFPSYTYTNEHMPLPVSESSFVIVAESTIQEGKSQASALHRVTFS